MEANIQPTAAEGYARHPQFILEETQLETQRLSRVSEPPPVMTAVRSTTSVVGRISLNQTK